MKETKEIYDLVIIGFGAAGLMAAATIGNRRVLVLEKNESAGKKVLISGKSQCNFTHTGQVTEFVKHYGAHTNFVKHAIGKWSPEREMDYFKELGVDHVIMENGKVFPKSMRAEDLVNALLRESINNGVHVLYKRRVKEILKEEEGFFCVKVHSQAKGELNTEKYFGKNVLLTTGGMTYPVTGSEGDGYRLAERLGHSVVQPRAALSPIYHGETHLKELAGVSIPSAQIKHLRSGKTLGSYEGDLLFTHKGLSGPVILNNSRAFGTGDELVISFTPLSPSELDAQIIHMGNHKGKSLVLAALKEWCYTKSMAECLYGVLGLSPALTFGELDKTNRKQIVQKITSYSIRIASVGGNQIGMATAGGVSLDEVKAKSMASKIVEGLYFAGEVLDVDGDTGGYNIQWAFSSARAAINEINTKL